jgi:predicted ATPase
MIIKRIKVRNFKSFRALEVELGKFNVLIGANASGKSNFIQILKFLRDITNHGLDNAVSMQGGVEFLRNINVGPSENLLVEIVGSEQDRAELVGSVYRARTGGYFVEIAARQATYTFGISFGRKGSEFEIAEDRLAIRGEFVRSGSGDGEPDLLEDQGEGEVLISYRAGKSTVSIRPPAKLRVDEYEIPPHLTQGRLGPKTLLIQHPFRWWPPLFEGIAIYDFDPKLPKKATPITGKAELEEDASNLAIVLKNILEDKEQKRRLTNFVKDLLPFVTDLDVEKFADKSLLFSLRESYSKGQYLPASLISDGTINLTALIVALYFERKPITVIEEPERNVHPHLISRIISMMKDAASKKQIIVTTHNPEFVKHADLKELLLVSRDSMGFSTVSRPSETDDVKVFLQNDMGIEDLFVQNLLRA